MACLVALGTLALAATPGPLGRVLIGQAWADQKDGRLPELFDRLLKSPSSETSEMLDGQIWEIWVEANDPEMNKLLAAGVEAMEAGDYPTALGAFNQLVEKKPDFAEGWNKRATLYYLMEEDEKSVADIDKTLALEPRHFGALSGLGLIHIRHERYEEAAKAYQRVLAIDPRNAGAQHNLEIVNDLIKKKSI
jgi:tetratricopeptide (TPR) repeat protein